MIQDITMDNLDDASYEDLLAFLKIKEIPTTDDGTKKKRTDLAVAIENFLNGRDPWSGPLQVEKMEPVLVPADEHSLDIESMTKEQLLALIKRRNEEVEIEKMRKELRADIQKNKADPHAKQKIRVQILPTRPNETGSRIPFMCNGYNFVLNTRAAGNQYHEVMKMFITGPIRSAVQPEVRQDGDPADGEVGYERYEVPLFTYNVHPEDYAKYFPEEMDKANILA